MLIDGQDICRHGLRSLRRQISLVTQETVLFQATVAANIAYGLARASPEQVRRAARQAYVHEFAELLPDGYDTLLGPRGQTVSGGQAQRIALARAILRDPAILILDEAFSQVDSESERRIRDALAEFVRGRTTFVVAQRLWTARSADRIVVMDAGRVIDDGTHEELQARCGLYQSLCRTQLTGGATEPAAPAADGAR